MALDIKAIQCPKCGSVYKTEIKQGFYRCQNCGTEYYLNNNDVHIYYHHEQATPPAFVPPSRRVKAAVYTFLILVFIVSVSYFIVMSSQSKGVITHPSYNTTHSVFATYVYHNVQTGDPVYVRFSNDYTYGSNGATKSEIHARYTNAVTGKLLHDRIMTTFKKSALPTFSFQTYGGNLIYAVDGSTTIYQLDNQNDNLINVTESLFRSFPQLSIGIAKYSLPSENYMTLLSNDGNTFYYFPVQKLLAANYNQKAEIENKENRKRHFAFAYPDRVMDLTRKMELQEIKYFAEAEKVLYRNFTPNRIYFSPSILYQDENSLIISSHITAGDESPVSIQSIDVNTGSIKWSFPPAKYFLYSSCKCKQGFAIEYRMGMEDDYVHGAFVISPEGKLINDFKLARTE